MDNEYIFDKGLEDNNIDIDWDLDYYDDEDYYEEISEEDELVECKFCTREFFRYAMEYIDGKLCCYECYECYHSKMGGYDDWHDEHSDDKKYDDEKEQYIYKRFMKFTKKTRLGHNIYEQPVPRGYIKE